MAEGREARELRGEEGPLEADAEVADAVDLARVGLLGAQGTLLHLHERVVAGLAAHVQVRATAIG